MTSTKNISQSRSDGDHDDDVDRLLGKSADPVLHPLRDRRSQRSLHQKADAPRRWTGLPAGLSRSAAGGDAERCEPDERLRVRPVGGTAGDDLSAGADRKPVSRGWTRIASPHCRHAETSVSTGKSKSRSRVSMPTRRAGSCSMPAGASIDGRGDRLFQHRGRSLTEERVATAGELRNRSPPP